MIRSCFFLSACAIAAEETQIAAEGQTLQEILSLMKQTFTRKQMIFQISKAKF